MKILCALGVAVAAFLAAFAVPVVAQERQPLRLIQTIPISNVKGRLDHMDADVRGRRLFVAGLENGSVEVIDLLTGKAIRNIPGFKKPQGIAYVGALNKLFVASGDDGMLRVFRGDTLELESAIKLDLGANRVAYDSRKRLIYVGYGGKDAGKDYGEVAVIDANKNEVLGEVRVAAHPSEIVVDRSGARAFVEISVGDQIQVIDAEKREVIATWPVSSHRPGDMAYDEATDRLFLGTHAPPEMVVMDSKSGKELAALPTVEGMDGVFFDQSLKRVYVSGGRGVEVGYIFVYQQDGDRYELISKIPTRAGAGTSLWVPELKRFYVAAPATDGDAGILVFEAQP
jgi:DNA-binding beta-propeller fold protein YncE